ncbi:MAG: LysR family transcriptional regulator [bacterium]|nr:LysR family transcriptional regulator [bacterium]
MKANLSSINLNLLVALDALLTDVNVTCAASRIHMTQSNLSKLLKQLRVLFDDELLVRGYSGHMILTSKAKSLKEPVSRLITGINKFFIDNDEFIPEESNYSYQLGMSDYISILILPKLLSKVNELAPNVKIKVTQVNDINSISEDKAESFDFIFAHYKNIKHNDIFEEKFLFDDNYLLAADKTHPAFKQENVITSEILKEYKIITALYAKELSEGVVVKALKKIEFNISYPLIVPNFLVALRLLKGTDFISVMPSKIAEENCNYFDLVTKSFPDEISVPITETFLCSNKAYKKNLAHIWFKKLINELSW